MDGQKCRQQKRFSTDSSVVNNNVQFSFMSGRAMSGQARPLSPYGNIYSAPNQQFASGVAFQSFCSSEEGASRASSPGELLLCESTLDGSDSESNGGEESRAGGVQLNDTGEFSSETSFQMGDRTYYQRNEVVVNPKSVAVCDDELNPVQYLLGSDETTVVVEPRSPDSVVIGENGWSGASSSIGSGSRPGSVEPSIEPVPFPSADEVMQRLGKSLLPVEKPKARTVIKVRRGSASSDDEDPCVAVVTDERNFTPARSSTGFVNKNPPSRLPPISHIAPPSRSPSPASSATGSPVQTVLPTFFGGVHNMTIPDSLKLLDSHIQGLHRQLVQHSIKMTMTSDVQTHLLMAQQQSHMLEAQRLLLQNQQLMMAQMYGAQANAAQIIHNFAGTSFCEQSENVVHNVESATTRQKSHPNVMQQLLTPPLAHYTNNEYSVVETAPADNSNHTPLTSKEQPVKREVVSPVDTLGIVQVLPSSLAVKREVVTPPTANKMLDRPSQVQFVTPPQKTSAPNQMSSLRDILARPPKVSPPDVLVKASGTKPVQTVSPFNQRPPVLISQSLLQPKPERRGVPMTKIRISPPSLVGPLKTSSDPANSFDCTKGTDTSQPSWSQSAQNIDEENSEGDYAARYASTPVKRRRRRPLGMNKKPYTKVCNLCQDVFYKPDDYKDHMNNRHASTFKYWCEECQKGYNDPRCIVEHKLKHENKDFPCTFCSKRFRSLSGFKRHQSEHTGNYLYRCAHCGEGYNIRKQFEAHQNRHTGHGYACFRCKKVYYHKAMLTNHMSRCLNRLSTEGSSPPPLSPQDLGVVAGNNPEGRSTVLSNIDNPMNRLNIPPLSPAAMDNCNSE